MDSISVWKIRLPKLWYLSWHSGCSAMSREIFHPFSKFNNSVCQNMSCSITGIPLLISESSLFLCSFLPHLFFLILRNKLICWWEGRKRQTFVLMLLPMKKHKVPFKACFHTWNFSTCLHPRDEPTDRGCLCEGSAVPQRGRRKTQNKLCESCAKQKWLTLKLKSVSRKLSLTWISSSSSGCWPITEGRIGQGVNTDALKHPLSWGIQAVELARVWSGGGQCPQLLLNCTGGAAQMWI